MTLREALGGDVRRIHQLVDALLDREDAMLALFDGDRVVTYAHGFGISPSQLELLSVEVERALRSSVGRQPAESAMKRRNRERNQGDRSGDGVDRDRRGSADGVLRLARKIA
jgi:hypothetical protein